MGLVNIRPPEVVSFQSPLTVETVFSVEKRTMGSHVLARVAAQQHKKLIFRAFSYNSRRLETLFLLFIEDFYRAPRIKDLICCCLFPIDLMFSGNGMISLLPNAAKDSSRTRL
jgi:hypothetical protein